MHFKIRYFRDGKLLSETPWTGTIMIATRVAVEGLIIHNADSVIVLDESGKEAARRYA